MQELFVGIYWPSRRETADDCARRTVEHFERLRKFSAALSDWYSTGSKSGLPFETSSLESIARRLAKSVQRRDVDRQPMPELGFRLLMDNRKRHNVNAVTSIRCGIWADTPNIRNAVTLRIAGVVPIANLEQRLVELARDLKRIWEASHARVAVTYSEIGEVIVAELGNGN